MSTARKLTYEQTEKVRIYHQTLAQLRGDKVPTIELELLESMTGTYNLIELYGGGDPVKAAHNLF